MEYNGKIVATYSSERGKMEKWWTIQSPSIVETNYYPLLNKDQTPFSVYWYDRYPEIMKPAIHQGSLDSAAPAAGDAPAADTL